MHKTLIISTILQGARQVGKTRLLKRFGAECFEEICYINFDEWTISQGIHRRKPHI
ncbi:AAA family ATPase [Bacteroides cellulosilyticus]|uniref:AAA family ATPase n=1 Tax=Bacteroides cellulosilyticus TaxID=246787 RepID=A0AAW8VP50_9BACE|nr:AAA family ATPase [Bacteroides cellulosilyticus]MDT4513989.1 AAA family ATPase [Bacteroides cellulosilyticus]